MNIKHYLILASSFLIISCSSNKTEDKDAEKEDHAHHDHSSNTAPSNSKSPRTASMANIGSVHVHIDYSSPSVRGREIFGGLVALDEIWVTGAHSATNISFDKDLLIEGKEVKSGKYALFTIPGKESWTVILNSNYNQHLADEYSEDKDVVRWIVDNHHLEQPSEQLVFDVSDLGNGMGKLEFKWSNRSFLLNFSEKM